MTAFFSFPIVAVIELDIWDFSPLALFQIFDEKFISCMRLYPVRKQIQTIQDESNTWIPGHLAKTLIIHLRLADHYSLYIYQAKCSDINIFGYILIHKSLVFIYANGMAMAPYCLNYHCLTPCLLICSLCLISDMNQLNAICTGFYASSKDLHWPKQWLYQNCWYWSQHYLTSFRCVCICILYCYQYA